MVAPIAKRRSTGCGRGGRVKRRRRPPLPPAIALPTPGLLPRLAPLSSQLAAQARLQQLRQAHCITQCRQQLR